MMLIERIQSPLYTEEERELQDKLYKQIEEIMQQIEDRPTGAIYPIGSTATISG